MEMRQPNEAQMSVINELDHNLILFASAGTGKTFTVAHRVRKVIETGRARLERTSCRSSGMPEIRLRPAPFTALPFTC